LIAFSLGGRRWEFHTCAHVDEVRALRAEAEAFLREAGPELPFTPRVIYEAFLLAELCASVPLTVESALDMAASAGVLFFGRGVVRCVGQPGQPSQPHGSLGGVGR